MTDSSSVLSTNGVSSSTPSPPSSNTAFERSPPRQYWYADADGNLGKQCYQLLTPLDAVAAQRTPVVLLRGTMGRKEWWAGFDETLAVHRPVLIKDHRGEGGVFHDNTKDYPAHIDYDLTEQERVRFGLELPFPYLAAAHAHDTARLIGYLWPGRRVHLWGQSLGSLVAQQLALDSPAIVASLVLVSTSPDFASNIHRRPAGQAMVAAFTAVEPKLPYPGPPASRPTESDEDKHRLHRIVSAMQVQRRPELLVGPDLLAKPEALQQMAGGLAALSQAYPVSLAVVANSAEVCRVFNVVDRYTPDAAVVRDRLPVLIMNGEDDPYFETASVRKLHELLPGSTLRLFPRAGHMLLVERKQEVVSETEAFLQRVDDGKQTN